MTTPSLSATNRPLFGTVADLAALVPSGSRLGIGGFHFSRLPLAQVRAVVAAGVRNLDYVSWGGGLALEMLLAADAVRSMKLCFDNLDVFGLAPRFREAVESGRVPLQDWTALGMIQGFQAARDGVDSLAFPPPVGSEIVERSGFATLHPDPLTGRVVASVPALPLDVFLLHAHRADAAGNLEIRGARGLDLGGVFAAKRVLATVEEIVPAGTLAASAAAHAFVLPRSFVAAIAEVPFGAWPTACLPAYPTDYAALRDLLAGSDLPAEPTPERRVWLGAAAAIPAARVTGHALRRAVGAASAVDADPEVDAPAAVEAPPTDASPTAAEIMIGWIASTIDDDSVCSVGSVSPLATVAYLLAKRTHAPNLVLMTSNGGLLDVAARPMLLALAESLDQQTAATHCGGDDSYHWYYQRGLVTHEVVSAAQVDRRGATNTIEVTSPSGRRIRLPGQGGMADVANMHHHFILYLPRHSPLSLVERVEVASAARGLLLPEERIAAGYQPGEVRLVTNLGVFRLDHASRELDLVLLHPGVALDAVQAATGFPLLTSPALAETPIPDPDALRMIREEIDPLGMRELEFVAGKDRGPMLDRIIAAEERAIDGLIASRASKENVS